MKTINIHEDYLMYLLVQEAKGQLHTLVSYMQETTPYGTAYQAAFDKYEKIREELAEFEDLLQDCVEVKSK